MGKAETYVGKPCKRGHSGLRYSRSKGCVACYRVLGAAWRQANPERYRAIKAAWVKANPGKRKASASGWSRANRMAMNAAQSQRRARERGAHGLGVSVEQWRGVLEASLGLCAYCNERRPLTMDHIEPLSRGGAHDVDNVTAACTSCNPSKGDKTLVVWLAARRVA